MPSLKSALQRIPFIRISGLFILGILLNHYIRLNDVWIGIALALHIVILVFLWQSKQLPGIKFQNILISSALLLSGAFYSSRMSENKAFISTGKEVYLAELCNKPCEKNNSYQSVLLLRNRTTAKDEKVIAYFSKKGFDTTLMAGDQLLIHVALQEIRPKVNAFEFDYKAMMQNKGIYYSVYLSPKSWQKTGIQSYKITYMAERFRDKLTGLLYKSGLEQKERAVVSALTLGYRSELDRETMSHFAETGTIHVLSVSGLHVALIFYILTLLLTPLKRGKYAVSLYAVLIILCLWCYAFITGFSPSVQRSTVMFSFVIIGSLLRRPVNIYNSLMASALLLILMDPIVLFDIGFQLSYLALFGIILLQPPLENLIPIKNKSLKWIWTLFTVSIAAQLITFPLSIFYFHQFPNLFWLSNFIAIPGTTFIIWLTFLFFVLSPLTFLSNVLADIIQFITRIMLDGLEWMSHLPHAVTDEIDYNLTETIFMYGLIFSFIIYCFSKNKAWLYSGLLLVILFQTSTLFAFSQLFNQKVVYHYATKSSIIHCINGRNNYILKTDNKPFDYLEVQLIKNACCHLKLNKPKVIMLGNEKSLYNNDIAVRNNVLNFLNCRIILSDQLTFNIRSADVEKFKLKNPLLITKKDMNLPVSQQKQLYQKSSFSIDFKIQCNEAVCIFID